MNKKAVVLLSGGLDSTTVLAIAKSEGYTIYALTFSYGQRHSQEIEQAKKIAQIFQVQDHKIIHIDLGLFGGSSLTDHTIAVHKDRTLSEMEKEIPNTYVPARNTIFLSYALAYAEVVDAEAIFIGVNALDYSGYPDCRPEYIEAFNRLIALATKKTTQGKSITIKTPIIQMTKSQIIQKGLALGVDYSITHSCYDPQNGLACGKCDSCILRKKGFEEAGVSDPTRYWNPSK